MTTEKERKLRRKWREDNKERINKTSREWGMKNRDKQKEYRDKFMFDGRVQEVLERDNFQCQDCEMTQETHIVLFNRRLEIHHIDGEGRNAEVKNNDLDNLKTICLRCHALIHRNREMKKKYGDLLEQDDSEYRYPKIREILDEKKKELKTIAKAKEYLAEKMGMSFWTIDHMYYERKEGYLTNVEKRRLSKLESKK